MENNIILDFFVDGIPKGQARPRVISKNGKTWAFNPINQFRDTVTLITRKEVSKMRNAGINFPYDCPLKINLMFYMPNKKETKEIWHAKKPDIDNLIKAVLDGMNDSGIWVDDCQICYLVCGKKYSNIINGVHIQAEKINE